MGEDTKRAIRTAAFRSLLRTGSPVEPAELAAGVGLKVAEVAELLRTMREAGRVRLDEQGRVVGAAGLNVTPDRHRIEMGDRGFWTWCAYDALGVLGALGVTGTARSFDPVDGAPLEVRFRLGAPEPTDVVLFRPDLGDQARCANLYEEWCSNSNFFQSEDAARTWAAGRDVHGQVFPLTDATELARQAWAPLTDGISL